MVIVEFSKYSHKRLTPEKIEQELVDMYKDLCKSEVYHQTWEEFMAIRTSSNRYCYDWETISSEKIIGTGTMSKVFNSIIVPWLRDRLQELQASLIYDCDYFDISIIDEDIYCYSFNIQKKDGLEYIVSKIKELVIINRLVSIRINGPVDDTGRNFIENIPLYDQDVKIERAKVK